MAPTANRLFQILAAFIGLTALFAAAYCQAPLYYSNQNQYFLHGLAAAGHGLLANDWLANTRDPTPVFSALVAFTARFLHPAAFYFYYALLLGAYAAALLGLFAVVAGTTLWRRWPIFLALVCATHAALPRWASYRLLGDDYPWFLQAGVAGQYVLGATLQPSAFGVLLVGAVTLFVRGWPFLAALIAALAATVHPTYLLPAGLLTAGFLAALIAEQRPRLAIGLAGWSLALVLPVLIHVLLTFGPTSAEILREAQALLVNVRIPHHTQPRLWLDNHPRFWIDPAAGFQIAWLVLGVMLARPPRLRMVLAVPALLATLLTLAQVATGSNALALLFPWRVSAVLVPVATAIILARLVALRVFPLDGAAARLAAVGLMAVLVAGGLWITVTRQGFHGAGEELAVEEFVRRTQSPGDVYFVPVTVPDLVTNTHGSLSSDFKPLPEKRTDARVIPVDLQGFRLRAGAPIFVDFKSVPYKDVDVLEWHARLRQAQEIQRRLREGRVAEAVTELRRLGVTHLIVPASQAVRGEGLEKVYGDESYAVYRLLSPE
jgi:hypothetical protein